MLLLKAWVLAPRVHHVLETTPLLLPRAWVLAPRVHQAPEAFHAPWLHVPAGCLVPAVPVAQAVLVALVAPVVLVQDSSVLVLLVAVSAPAVPVHQVALEPPHVPDLALTVHPQVAVAVVAVVPVVELPVRSVVVAESPRHVSRRERKEQSLSSARHLRLVA